jgi:hypothetical protein
LDCGAIESFKKLFQFGGQTLPGDQGSIAEHPLRVFTGLTWPQGSVHRNLEGRAHRGEEAETVEEVIKGFQGREVFQK